MCARVCACVYGVCGIRRRRKIVARVLRAVGLKHRHQQRAFLESLSSLGLHPDTFTLGINAMLELKEDYEEMKQELRHYEEARTTLSLSAWSHK